MIRDARPTDAAAIAAIWNPIIRDTDITFNPVEKTEAEIAALIADRQAAGHAFLVAEPEVAHPWLCQLLPVPRRARAMRARWSIR
jgi:L-amino acid N-acyltransferase YncA